MSTWRTKTYSLQLAHRGQLRFKLRKFKTLKSRRSTKIKQIVIPVYDAPIREIAVQWLPRTAKPNSIVQLLLPSTMVVIGLLGIGLFTLKLTAAQALSPSPVKTFTATKNIAPKTQYFSLPYSQPTHLSISSVNIDADLIAVGLDINKSIEMPPLFSWKAGWYNQSPAPGQIGPAIIVGHLDTYKNISVFWRLGQVKPGDLIKIQRQDDKTASFKVTGLAQYDQNNFPTNKVYGNINYAGLRLITCGGPFDRSTGHYTKNTVVFAALLN